MSVWGHDHGDTHAELYGAPLGTARELVVWTLLQAGIDELEPDEPDLPEETRRAAAVLDRIGWPGDPLTSVILERDDLRLLRRAALVGLGAAAEAVEEAAGQATHGSGVWDGRDAMAELRRCTDLLDLLGWPATEERGPAETADDAASDLEAAVLVFDPHDGAIRSVSRRFAEMSGFTAAELVGTTPPYPFALADDSPDRGREAILALLGCGRFVETTRMMRRRDGVMRPVRVYLTPVWGADGAVQSVAAVVMDESARLRIADALLDEDERLRRLLDGVPVHLWTLGPDGRTYTRNRAWREWLGRPAEERRDPGTLLTAIHPDDRHLAGAIVRPALAEGRAFEVELRLRNAGGEHRWVLLSGMPRHGGDGAFLGHIGTALDVHDRKLREMTLQEAAGRLAAGDGARDGLHRLAGAVAEDLPALIAEEAADLLGADGCLVVRFHGRGAAVVAGAGLMTAGDARIPASGQGSLAPVRMLGRPGRVDAIETLDEDDAQRLVAEAKGIRSTVSAPLHLDGRPWGAIVAGSRRPAAFGADDEARLARFSVLAGLALGARAAAPARTRA
jgi:PAS domain S-box-containing protein